MEKNKNYIKPDSKTLGKKQYHFKNGIECFQEELDTEQFHEIICLMSSVEISSPEELQNLSINKIISILKSKNIMSDFLLVILRDVNGNSLRESGIEKINIKMSELMEVLKDFFYINPTVQKLWENFGKILDSKLLNSVISNINPKSQKNPRTS